MQQKPQKEAPKETTKEAQPKKTKVRVERFVEKQSDVDYG